MRGPELERESTRTSPHDGGPLLPGSRLGRWDGISVVWDALADRPARAPHGGDTAQGQPPGCSARSPGASLLLETPQWLYSECPQARGEHRGFLLGPGTLLSASSHPQPPP